jgi:hypothetical protein
MLKSLLSPCRQKMLLLQHNREQFLMTPLVAVPPRERFPSQTTYVARDIGLNETKSKEATERVRTWREQGVLPFPDFMPDDIEKFENKLEYPEPGSTSRKL